MKICPTQSILYHLIALLVQHHDVQTLLQWQWQIWLLIQLTCRRNRRIMTSYILVTSMYRSNLRHRLSWWARSHTNSHIKTSGCWVFPRGLTRVLVISVHHRGLQCSFIQYNIPWFLTIMACAVQTLLSDTATHDRSKNVSIRTPFL